MAERCAPTDEVLATRLRRLRNLGQRSKGEHIEIGFNERLDGLQAALLRVKLAHLDRWNAARRRHAEQYRELLPRSARLAAETQDRSCVYHLFPARFEDRDAVAARLQASGIETGIHYAPALHGHPVWGQQMLRHGALPHAEAWAAQELSLPMHPDLLLEEIERVAQAIDLAVPVQAA